MFSLKKIQEKGSHTSLHQPPTLNSKGTERYVIAFPSWSTVLNSKMKIILQIPLKSCELCIML